MKRVTLNTGYHLCLWHMTPRWLRKSLRTLVEDAKSPLCAQTAMCNVLDSSESLMDFIPSSDLAILLFFKSQILSTTFQLGNFCIGFGGDKTDVTHSRCYTLGL